MFLFAFFFFSPWEQILLYSWLACNSLCRPGWHGLIVPLLHLSPKKWNEITNYFKIILLLYASWIFFVSVHAYIPQCLLRSEEGAWFPGAGVIDGCELGIEPRTFCKRNKCSSNHWANSPIPTTFFFLNVCVRVCTRTCLWVHVPGSPFWIIEIIASCYVRDILLTTKKKNYKIQSLA